MPGRSAVSSVPAARLGLCWLLLACSQDVDEQAVSFVDVSEKAGLVFTHFNGARGDYLYPETMGSGAAFFDFDADGNLDLYLLNGAELAGDSADPAPVNHLFRNLGDGTFADVSRGSGVADASYGTGCAAGDADGDGDSDLFITAVGPNRLFRNAGDGRFSDATAAWHVGDPRWGTSCGFLDFDRDGDLDLFVVNYVKWSTDGDVDCRRGKLRAYCTPEYYEPERDILYRNDGDRYVDVTETLGVNRAGPGLGVGFADVELDGDTDIFVANDGRANFLYRNDDGAGFAEVGLQAGVRFNGHGVPEASMGVDFGDFDGDADSDLFVTNFALETNTLYRNIGAGRFVDATSGVGLAEPTFVPLGFGTRFVDFDNDTDLDLVVANGHVIDNIALVDPNQVYEQTDQLLRNGTGLFSDVSTASGVGFATPGAGRGLAVADYDNDGDLDFLVTTVGGEPRLLRNDGGNSLNWLKIELIDREHGATHGTRVSVLAGGTIQVRELQSGASYLSAHDPRLHFGLGRSASADVEIVWPDGVRQQLAGVSSNQILRVEPGLR